ncbi:helix-turn-helix transcriptional regulator [Patescibacteria group bacterium]|nr:helix-turn-helix transcriptional regulator [Patescibacteria group bacterium]
MSKVKNQFKDFIKSHPNTNFKKYIIEKAKRDPNVYYRVDKEAERLVIAAEIVALRKKHKLTQVQLAKKAQTSQSALAQIESGKRSPTTDTLIKIANAMGTELKISFAKA